MRRRTSAVSGAAPWATSGRARARTGRTRASAPRLSRPRARRRRRTDGRQAEQHGRRAVAARAWRAAQASPARVRRTASASTVGDEVVRRGVGDPGGDDVAGAQRRPGAQVDEAVVAGPTAHPVRGAVLAALALGDQHLDDAADQRRFSAQAISSCSATSRSYRSWTTALGTWLVHRRRRSARPRPSTGT